MEHRFIFVDANSNALIIIKAPINNLEESLEIAGIGIDVNLKSVISNRNGDTTVVTMAK